MINRIIDVTEAPFNAAGDGMTCDRQAIQAAIDHAYSMGGGTVELKAGRKFLSGGIILKSNVHLHFGDRAELIQSSSDEDYVMPDGDGYIPYNPEKGHNWSEEIKWSHLWYKNYPLIFAPEGSHDFSVTGSGTIRMMPVESPETLMKLCPIGFYRVKNFVISDVHITNYHSYAIMPFTSENGIFKNLIIDNSNHGNGDGICIMNCKNIRVTGCKMFTGDDSVYIFSSYRDPRKSSWWSSDEPQASENIEIDHNDLESNHCKAFGMILWGIDCPDKEKIEVRNVYVHDNRFKTMGNWLYNPYSNNPDCPPVTGVRFENNEIEGIEINFFETQISDMNHYHSQMAFHNGNFKDGRVFWSYKGDYGLDITTESDGDVKYGCLNYSAGEYISLYQGIYILGEKPLLLRAKVFSEGGASKLFVCDLDTGEEIASEEISGSGWRQVSMKFKVPKSGNYHLGICGNLSHGRAGITDVSLYGNSVETEGCCDILDENGKIIFLYK